MWQGDIKIRKVDTEYDYVWERERERERERDFAKIHSKIKFIKKPYVLKPKVSQIHEHVGEFRN